MAIMLRRIKVEGIRGVMIMGEFMDFAPLVAAWQKAVGKIVSRRGIDWVNRLASEHAVVFSHGG